MGNRRSTFTRTKQSMALRLASGECAGSYGDAVIILCAAISALAADVWPRQNNDKNDRRKFVEALTALARGLGTTRISIPLLVAFLRGPDSKVADTLEVADTLGTAFLNFDPTQVLTGDEVDKSEQEIARLCPRLKPKEIRQFSYANLLYEEIRCGYAHAYSPGKRAESWPLNMQEAPVSYHNKVIYSNNEAIRSRLIHFRVEWIADVAVTIATAVDAMDPTLLPYPPRWWIDG